MRTTDVGAWASPSSLWYDPPPSSLALLLIVAGYRVSLHPDSAPEARRANWRPRDPTKGDAGIAIDKVRKHCARYLQTLAEKGGAGVCAPLYVERAASY